MKKLLQWVLALFSVLLFNTTLVVTTIVITSLVISTPVMAEKDVRYYLTQATNYYNQGKYLQAEKAFRQLLKMEVSLHEDFYFFYGKTLFHNGQYKLSSDNLTTYTQSVDKKNRYYANAKKLLKQAQKNLAKQQREQPRKKKKTIKSSPGAKPGVTIVPQMVRIPADSFIMGSNHGSEDQQPPHKMTINDEFAIGKYEVTFEQYDAYAIASKRKMPDDYGWGRGNRPVINVSFKDAQDYARWLSKKTKRKFRLPTETEWEYVARTGLKNQLGFTDLIGLNDANCDGCRYFWESAQTVSVGNYEPNKYGLHDLFGNVWEWTCSLYTRRYNGKEQYCADNNDLQGNTISVRGGGWDTSKKILRSYIRYNNFPTYTSNELGFRLVEDL